MRKLSWIMAAFIVAAPAVARADWKETVALATGALAGPVILAGAAITAIEGASAPRELPPDSHPSRHKPPELSLVPTIPAQPAPLEPTAKQRQERAKAEQQMRLNDTITNVGLAVGAAGVLTSIIVGIAKKK
jgi:hypothetical protein